jgi:outer membrane receptor protein involved in Fe transport
MAQRYILTLGLTDAAQQAILPDFRKLDAALYYTLGDLSFALNVDNLTNELNIFGTFDRNLRTWAYMPQAGTNWRMTVSVKF